MSNSTAIRAPKPRAEGVKEACCPCCKALLFLFRADGEAGTK